METTPQAIQPIYTTEGINEAISIVSGEEVVVRQEGNETEGTVDVALKWIPTPKVRFELSPTSHIGSLDEVELYFPQREITVPVLCIATRIGAGEARYSLTLSGDVSVDDSVSLSEVIFSLPNFWNFAGNAISYPVENGYMGTRGRCVLEDGEWCITLDAVMDLRILMESLRGDGGFGITHVGRIQRCDGTEFSTTQAEEMILSLQIFLSFVRGMSVAPVLPVGLNQNGDRVWEPWTVPIVDTWKDVSSWFDILNAQALPELYPGYMRVWWDATLGASLTSLVNWYTISNRLVGRSDGSIMFAQGTLELLSWKHLVERGGFMTADGFNRLTAADQIRLLLVQLDIPTEIPEDLEVLAAKGRELNQDGIGVMTYVRNTVTHPIPRRSEQLETNHYHEAWMLSQWYIEMSLLRLFGYAGVYSNRLKRGRWQGDVEPVPWA